MTFYALRPLSPVMQFYWVLKHGTYLAQRWEDEGGVNLYQMASKSTLRRRGGAPQNSTAQPTITVKLDR
jgi:hypothetical protein